MKSLLLSILFVTSGFIGVIYAQESVYAMHCQMSVDDVLRQDQPFNMDDVVGETAMILVGELIDKIKGAYNAMNSDDKIELNNYKKAIDGLLQEAEKIELNLAMFSDDFKFINNFNSAK